jgi:hypothetical protein
MTKRLKSLACRVGLILFPLVTGLPLAQAVELTTVDPDLKLRWDTTVKYSSAVRVESRSSALVDSPPATINGDDGDRNLGRGLISNRLDVFSEADLLYRNVGARVSFAGWYDKVYNAPNDNDSPLTANQRSVPYNRFTADTRRVHGRDIEVLDAFVFGSTYLGDVKASFRAGRHALLWGESLFFGSNGIAGAQAPVDVIKLIAVPNSQFKETIRPVGQVSGQLQLSKALSLAGYYQYEWEKSRLPGVGSYFSSSDIVDIGGERLVVGPPLVPGGGPAAFFRGADQPAKNLGQGGVTLRLHTAGADYGLYAVRWHSKTPFVYVRPGVLSPPGGGPSIVLEPAIFNPPAGQLGQYTLVYPEKIRTFGVSATTTVGDANIAGELSIRRNTPLASKPLTVTAGLPADNDGNPAYAVGNSAHAQASVVWALGPTVIARSAIFLAEVAWNRVTGTTRNAQNRDPNATDDAVALRTVFEPTYRQVFPGVDITVPMGLSYSPRGRSSAVGGFAVDKGGDMNVGLTVTYLETWRATLALTHFYGKVAATGYAQNLGDRDYVAFTLRTTF